jgi:hypothetical protein
MKKIEFPVVLYFPTKKIILVSAYGALPGVMIFPSTAGCKSATNDWFCNYYAQEKSEVSLLNAYKYKSCPQ